MYVWLEVYDPTYTTKVEGPVVPIRASISRPLDGLGSGSVTVAGNDVRALQAFADRRVVEVWVQRYGRPDEAPSDKRKLGAFVIEDQDMGHQSGQMTYTVSGSSTMLKLRDTNTYLGLIFDNQTVASVLSDLAGLAGWSVDADAALSSDNISLRFDGSNVFKAMQTVVQAKGIHLREGTATNTIEAGAFGEAAQDGNGNTVLIEYIEGDTDEGLYDENAPLLIERVRFGSSSADIVNYALGLGAGNGDAVLTMENSTRAFVESVTKNGRTHYIVQDASSVAAYGQIEKRVNVKRLAPVGVSEAQLEDAANALADAVQAYVDRHKEPQETLELTLRNVRQNIRAGDKVHLRYEGKVWYKETGYVFKSINADFWVMRAEESVSGDGNVLTLEISNIDRYRMNAADIIVGALEGVEVQEVGVQPYLTKQSRGPYDDLIDDSNNVTFDFPIDDDVLEVLAVTMEVRRRVFTATASAAADGGGVATTTAADTGHRHRLTAYNGKSAWSDPLELVYHDFGRVNPANTTPNTLVLGHNPRPGDSFFQEDLFTFDAGGSHSHNLTILDHTHDLTYGINRDEAGNLLEDVDVTVNGVAVATGILTGGATKSSFDITSAVLGKAGGYKQDHDVTVSCASGQGIVRVEIFMVVKIGTVRNDA